MPVPAAIYLENPRFAAPRAYWQCIAIGYGPDAVVSRADNVVHIHEDFVGGFIDTYVTLDPRFIPWSSNRWTLDFIFTDQVSYLNGNPTPLYFTCAIGFGLNPLNGHWCCTLAYPGGTDYYFSELPAAPTSYWLPIP